MTRTAQQRSTALLRHPQAADAASAGGKVEAFTTIAHTAAWCPRIVADRLPLIEEDQIGYTERRRDWDNPNAMEGETVVSKRTSSPSSIPASWVSHCAVVCLRLGDHHTLLRCASDVCAAPERRASEGRGRAGTWRASGRAAGAPASRGGRWEAAGRASCGLQATCGVRWAARARCGGRAGGPRQGELLVDSRGAPAEPVSAMQRTPPRTAADAASGLRAGSGAEPDAARSRGHESERRDASQASPRRRRGDRIARRVTPTTLLRPTTPLHPRPIGPTPRPTRRIFGGR